MPCGLPASSGLRSITAGGYTRCWADGSRAPLQGLRASRALVPVSTYRQRARQLGSRPHASPSYTTHHALGISSSHSPRVVEVAAAPIFLVCPPTHPMLLTGLPISQSQPQTLSVTHLCRLENRSATLDNSDHRRLTHRLGHPPAEARPMIKNP